jgi:hypothetical protein
VVPDDTIGIVLLALAAIGVVGVILSMFRRARRK